MTTPEMIAIDGAAAQPAPAAACWIYRRGLRHMGELRAASSAAGHDVVNEP